STERITGLLRTRPGAEYNPDLLAEDMRKLVSTHQFGIESKPRIVTRTDGRIDVIFELVEMPSTIQEIVYQGARHLKPAELTTITGLRKGAPLSPQANRIACQAIIRRYNDDGRPFASCDLLEGDKPGDSRVVFNITEGPVVKVCDIEITGNTFVSSA